MCVVQSECTHALLLLMFTLRSRCRHDIYRHEFVQLWWLPLTTDRFRNGNFCVAIEFTFHKNEKKQYIELELYWMQRAKEIHVKFTL